MTDSYQDAERRVLAALVLDWHRSGDRLLGVEELRQMFGLEVDQKVFDAIAADLERRSMVLTVWDKQGAAVALQPAGYKAAFSVIASELRNPPTFAVNWEKEEVCSEAAAPEWFPMPDGWKWYQLSQTQADVQAHRAITAPLAPPGINWQKWGVIVAALAAILSAAVAALVHLY